MNYIFILLTMLFLHIVDDFHLQGLLTSMKQVRWWNDQASKLAESENLSASECREKYKYDWLVCLIWHSFQWTFVIMLPAIFFKPVDLTYLLMFGLNALVHGIVDHLKCNKLKINLVTDQLIHVAQILITWLIIFVL